jgi:S-adenosylmethionine hydrolase
MSAACIALLTDFGAGEYTGIMKGVLADLAPGTRVIDVSHDLSRFSILSAAYVLYSAWDYFPRGTVFCVVVDPGVGSRRELLFAEAEQRRLVAPDNGVVSLLARFKADLRCYRLRRPDSRGPSGSSWSATFHGRDILAPAAARAAAGKSGSLRGDVIEPHVSPHARPEASRQDSVYTGRILHIDHFGTCVSSLHTSDLQILGDAARLRVTSGPFSQVGLKQYYEEVPRGQPLAYLGSSGFLEIALREENAARRLGLRLLDRVSAATAEGEST